MLLYNRIRHDALLWTCCGAGFGRNVIAPSLDCEAIELRILARRAGTQRGRDRTCSSPTRPSWLSRPESSGRRSVIQPDGRTVKVVKSIDRAQICVTAVFAAHALVFSSWVAHIPHVKSELRLSDGALATRCWARHWVLWSRRRCVSGCCRTGEATVWSQSASPATPRPDPLWAWPGLN